MSSKSARYSVMARHAAHNADHTSPLRKVIRWALNPNYPELGATHLLLECGHVVRPPRGAWSDEYSAGTRRRCYECAKEMAAP